MRLRFAIVMLVGSVSGLFAGNLAPLTVKDISLMLRSGYSSDSVQREIASRRAMEPLDAAAEKNLVQAGASPAFIAALKSGVYAVAPAQVDAVKADLAAKAQRRAAQAEESRTLPEPGRASERCLALNTYCKRDRAAGERRSRQF